MTADSNVAPIEVVAATPVPHYRYLRRARRAAMFVLSVVVVAVGWELYKRLGPQDGGSVLGWKILPRAKDRVMPHV